MGKEKVVNIDLAPPDTVYLLFKRGAWPMCYGSSGYASHCYVTGQHRGHSALCYESYDKEMTGATEGDMVVAFKRTNNYQLKMVPV